MKQMPKKSKSSEVLAFFFEHPYTEAYVREVARALKMSASTVLRALVALEKAGLLERRETRNATYFKANMAPEFKAHKIAYTISKIAASGIVGKVRARSRGLNCFLLYGSAARGEDGENSDYDFLVIAAECGITGTELGENLRRETSLKKLTIGEWKETSKKNRAFYLEVISDSFPLYGKKPVMD